MLRILRYAVLAGVILGLPASALAAPTTIDFEAMTEGDSVTNQFAGLTFTNSTVLTAGSGLNDIDFPPHSGVNAVLDDGGPISIFFTVPIASFSAYFNYVTPITIRAYGAGLNLLGSVSSVFAMNGAASGEPGSSPNELLTLFFAGIASVTITGDPSGGSFFLDDVTTTSGATAVPEPATIVLLTTSLIGLGSRVRRKTGV